MIDEIERERDPEYRADALNSLMNSLSASLTAAVQRACLDLFRSGMQTDVIADRLGISQRAVKRFIARQSTLIGIPNPLMKQDIGAYIDIRSLLGKAAASQPMSSDK